MDKEFRQSFISGYEWPKDLLSNKVVATTIKNLLDIEVFNMLLNRFSKSEDIIITLLSKEYIKIGHLWLSHILKVKYRQFIVIATDEETGLFLDQINIPNYKAFLIEDFSVDDSFISKTGFNKKALAITALKYPIAKIVLEQGFNVLLMDIDALMLHRFSIGYVSGVDIAFQRVLYFPAAIAKIWGFVACSGFIWFKSNRNIIRLIAKAIEIQETVYSDQLALNIALFESDISWNTDHNFSGSTSFSEDEMKSAFVRSAIFNIDGYSNALNFRVRSLTPKLFWRNDIVNLSLSDVIVFHPNSPKNATGKLEVFRKFGIY